MKIGKAGSLILAGLLLFVAEQILKAQSLKTPPETNVQLKVASDQRVFLIARPIDLTLTIVNVGKKALYVPKSPSLIGTVKGQILINVWDARHKLIPTTSTIVNEQGGLEFSNWRTALERDYVLLRPTQSSEVEVELNPEINEFPAKPGTYEVSASLESYFPYLRRRSRLDNDKSSPSSPIFEGKISSNTITVRIRESIHK